jgi:hypothetical protein
MHKDAGIFYEIRFRLRGRLSHHHWKLGRPFTPIQEDAWMLLNEVEQMVQILQETERRLGEENSEYAFKVRHTLLIQTPASKEDLEISRVHQGGRTREMLKVCKPFLSKFPSFM